jgi:hypothetical protein
VGIYTVGADSQHFRVELPQLRINDSDRCQFGRSNECKIT